MATEPRKEAVEHELKCWPPFFDVLALGIKTFEYRKDDRGYRAGDTLRLREFNPFEEPPAYTGREIERRITYVLGSNALASIPTGYVVMSLANPEAIERNRWEQEVRERLEKLPRFDCEEEEGNDYYRTRSAVMIEYDDGMYGDWLRHSDVLATLNPSNPGKDDADPGEGK